MCLNHFRQTRAVISIPVEDLFRAETSEHAAADKKEAINPRKITGTDTLSWSNTAIQLGSFHLQYLLRKINISPSGEHASNFGLYLLITLFVRGGYCRCMVGFFWKNTQGYSFCLKKKCNDISFK